MRQPIASIGHRHREDRPDTAEPPIPRQPPLVFTMTPHTTRSLVLTGNDAANPYRVPLDTRAWMSGGRIDTDSASGVHERGRDPTGISDGDSHARASPRYQLNCATRASVQLLLFPLLTAGFTVTRVPLSGLCRSRNR